MKPGKHFLLTNKPTIEELERMVKRLQSEGYYLENLNRDGVIVKGRHLIVRHKEYGAKNFAAGFSENQAWMEFLGWE